MNTKRKCHLKYCQSGLSPTAVIYECDEIECFSVPVCKECLEALGLKPQDHYDDTLQINKKLRKYYNKKLTANLRNKTSLNENEQMQVNKIMQGMKL